MLNISAVQSAHRDNKHAKIFSLSQYKTLQSFILDKEANLLNQNASVVKCKLRNSPFGALIPLRQRVYIHVLRDTEMSMFFRFRQC